MKCDICAWCQSGQVYFSLVYDSQIVLHLRGQLIRRNWLYVIFIESTEPPLRLRGLQRHISGIQIADTNTASDKHLAEIIRCVLITYYLADNRLRLPQPPRQLCLFMPFIYFLLADTLTLPDIAADLLLTPLADTHFSWDSRRFRLTSPPRMYFIASW